MGFREDFTGAPQRAYGDYLANRFWLKKQKTHVTDTFKRGVLAVTHVRSDTPTPQPTQSIGYDDAYLVALQLREVSDHELWEDARPIKVDAFAEKSTNFYDLRRDPVAFVRQPFHSLQFYMPRAVLGEIARRNGYRFQGDLTCPCGVSRADPVIHHIGAALVPALEQGGAIEGLFLDHILQAVALHVVGAYGEAARTGGRASGGLASWQERRAKEMMQAACMRIFPCNSLPMPAGYRCRTSRAPSGNRPRPHRIAGCGPGVWKRRWRCSCRPATAYRTSPPPAAMQTKAISHAPLPSMPAPAPGNGAGRTPRVANSYSAAGLCR